MSTPKIISRYILRQFMMSFFAVMLTLGFIILLFDVLELMKDESISSFGFAHILFMGVLKLPNMILTVLPFLVLIASIVVFWRLTKSNELVIIRAAGQSVWQFVSPLLYMAFFIGVFAITIFNPFSAMMQGKFIRMNESKTDTPYLSSSEGLWLREHKDGKMFVLHANGLRHQKHELTLHFVNIFVFNEDNSFEKRINADKAVLQDGFFSLENVQTYENGKIIQEKQVEQIPTKLTAGKIQENFASPETISFWHLPHLIEFFESSGFSAHSHRLHLQSLFTTPLLLMTMVLIAAVFSVDPNQRKGGGALKVSCAIASGFLLYFMTRITYALGFSTALPVGFATWSPPIIFALISVSILLHREDG